MSVSNGQNADETTFNTAYPSRIVDTSMAGVVALQNTDTASGPSITNTQQAINNGSHSVLAILSITASGSISIDETIGELIIPVVGDAGAQDASLTPFGATGLGSGGNAWTNGQRVKLIGTDNTNTVTYKNNDVQYGAILNGDAKLEKYSTLDLVWVAALERWIETGRSI